VGRLAGLLNFVGDTLHALFEPAQAFTETLAELGKLLAAEEHEDDDAKKQKMWCGKQFTHGGSPCRIAARPGRLREV
jgi:hypothetical protein